MSVTDTSEKGLETLIMLHMTGVDGLTAVPDWMAAETPDFLARDRQARRHRCAAPGRQARPAALRSVLRHAVAGQPEGRRAHALNRFSVTRQLALQPDETRRALDLALFINGLPVATFELKNSLTKQTVEDAVEQYKRDRDPREKLFEFGRCVVHFAVDDAKCGCARTSRARLLVPALQQGLQRRRGQPAQPRRAQDRLPLEAQSSRRRG
jgi:hypothetical protein